jgi:hypothetical protein
MKPHLCKIRGLWYCIGAGAFGLGFDPEQAFQDWEKSSEAGPLWSATT